MSRPERYRFLTLAPEPGTSPRAEVSVQTDGTVATMRLYDVIDSYGGYWGVSAKEFAEALDGLGSDVTELRLHINSPGGEASEGIAILNLLRQHPARVVVTVDGLAASAASFVAMAGDEIVMAPNAEMMIHDAWGYCVGNVADMRKVADMLDHLSDNLADIYFRRAGGSVASWREAMIAETWYSAEEAVTAGLANRVLPLPAEQAEPAAQARARFDLRAFAHAGRAQAPDPLIPPAVQAGATAAAGSTTGEEPDTMSDTLMTGLRERLGIADDADEATALSALDEALAEQGDPAPAAQVMIPDGHVTIPAARLADLEAGAAAGTAAQARLNADERERFLDSVRTKFLASNRQAWADEYDRNPETTRAHFAQAPDLLPTADIGHTGKPEDTVTTRASVRETPAYANWKV